MEENDYELMYYQEHHYVVALLDELVRLNNSYKNLELSANGLQRVNQSLLEQRDELQKEVEKLRVEYEESSVPVVEDENR